MSTQAWIEAASAVVATLTLIVSVWVLYRAYRESTLRAWQRVVIYSLIEEAEHVSFDELKSRYLQKAQQLLKLTVPKKEIQDDALRRILLELQKDGLVIRNPELCYQIQLKIPLDAWAFDRLMQTEIQARFIPKILAIVESASGVYTIDTSPAN